MLLRIARISWNPRLSSSSISISNRTTLERQRCLSGSCPSSRPHHSFSTTTPFAAPSPPFFKLSKVKVPVNPIDHSQRSSAVSAHRSQGAEIEVDWTIDDLGKSQCWAIVGPASEKAAMVKKGLVQLLVGQTRPKTGSTSSNRSQHPPAHPFLSGTSTHASQVIQHVSFSTRLSNSNATSTGFQDYSVRYGAIREDEDKVTLFESLMNNLGCKIGNVARRALVPDALSEQLPTSFLNSKDDVSSSSHSSRFKWKSKESYEKNRERALALKEKVTSVGELLDLGPELMNRPLIALSNGQTRRARIANALLSGTEDCEALILTEPYTGLDPKTRKSISSLLERLHSEKNPRVVLILREQDEIPQFITNILGIQEDGSIGFLGERKDWDQKVSKLNRTGMGALELEQEKDGLPKLGMQGGLERVRKNRELGLGRGDDAQQPLVDIRGLTIKYGDKVVLDNIDFTLYPSSTLILAGSNGSGKTTLLSLILGDHPRSYSFPSSVLSLFGEKRSSPSNSTSNLLKKVGHLSPELFNSFPRKSLEYGGMDVEDCVGSGFEGIFCRRKLSEKQKKRIKGLVRIFKDLIITTTGASNQAKTTEGDEIEKILKTAFASLSSGSQAVVLFLRSIVHSPRLLVLDEPFQGMDSKQVQRVRAYLDSRHLDERNAEFNVGETEEEKSDDERKRKEMSLVLVSHYEQEYPVSAGRLVRLDEGKVVEMI